MTVLADAPVAEHAGTGRVRLKRAGLSDAGSLAALSRLDGSTPELSTEQMSSCIEHGGALYYEDDNGPVSMLAWRESPQGWDLQPFTTTTSQDDLGHSRWLMTQVEALAIRLNVPRLVVQAADSGLAEYYRRLGYEREAPGSLRLVKRVGGTWQLRPTGSAA